MSSSTRTRLELMGALFATEHLDYAAVVGAVKKKRKEKFYQANLPIKHQQITHLVPWMLISPPVN